MRSRSLRVAAVGVAMLILAQGCGRETAKPGVKKIAFITNNVHAFWTIAEKGTEKSAKEYNVTVEFKMPTPDTMDEQRKIVEDLLVKGIDGIAISANDAKNSSGYLAKVGKQVPLITVDNDITDVAGRRAYIGTHNYRAGRAAGKLVAEAVPGGGKIAIFVGNMDAANAVERRQGVLDYLAGLEQKEIGLVTPAGARNIAVGRYTLVDTRTDGADAGPKCRAECEDILSTNPDIVAVVGLWAYNPPALLQAVENMKSKAAIIGFDEYPETLKAIKAGKIAGTVVQAPYQFGAESVKLLAALARGDEAALKSYPGLEMHNRIYIPHRVIIRDNVDAFETELNALLGK